MIGRSVVITGLFVGQVQQLWPGRAPSAIAKKRTHERLRLGPNGFEVDQQADLSVHGGPEKAVHHYAGDHYPAWREDLSHLADRLRPGAFGENLSTLGFTEESMCIGDLLTMGTARVQISQGRQPCWKLNAHLDEKTLAARFQKTGRVGWYYRVLESGTVAEGDTLELLDRPQPDWSPADVMKARFNPQLDTETAADLSRLPELAQGWRAAFARKADGASENTDKRLLG